MPIIDRGLHHRLSSLMRVYLEDRRQGWELQPDGSYVQRTTLTPDEAGSHQILTRDPWGLDRSESRYVTQEFRAAAFAPAPEPHQHAVAMSNGGRKRKTRRNGGG